MHEDLPLALRAPTSLLLAPVAIADGVATYLGLEGGVYDSLPRVFLANWLGWAIVGWLLAIVRSRWAARKKP